MAADGGTPSLTDTDTLLVNVDRNLASPVFAPQSYDITILETQTLTQSIVQVTASDGDSQVPEYFIYFF